jgi:hypothetical protein
MVSRKSGCQLSLLQIELYVDLASLACPCKFPKVNVRIFKTLVVFLVFVKFDLVKALADFKTK